MRCSLKEGVRFSTQEHFERHPSRRKKNAKGANSNDGNQAAAVKAADARYVPAKWSPSSPNCRVNLLAEMCFGLKQ